MFRFYFMAKGLLSLVIVVPTLRYDQPYLANGHHHHHQHCFFYVLVYMYGGPCVKIYLKTLRDAYCWLPAPLKNKLLQLGRHDWQHPHDAVRDKLCVIFL